MNTLAQNRLFIYDLLYNNPLCRYIRERDGKKELNVLILTQKNPFLRDELFKAVFWCGQIPDVELKITLASDDTNVFFFSEEYTFLKTLIKIEQRPNLDVIPQKYATVRIADFKESDSLDCFSQTDYDSCFIDTANASLNKKIARACLRQTHSQAIHIIADEDIPDEGAIRYHNKNREVSQDLLQTAEAIHLGYTMFYNERDNKAQARKEFRTGIQQELLKNELGDFLGGNYNIDSSLASATSYPNKLFFIHHDEETAKKIFATLFDKKDALYNDLMYMEHRRWLAYMATRGYRAPTNDELVNDRFNVLFYYSEENSIIKPIKNRNDVLRIHACMCESDRNGSKLNDLSFSKEITPKNDKDYCPLDQVSLKCNKRLKQKDFPEIKEKIKDALSEFPNDILLFDYRASIQKLFDNDIENTVPGYYTEYNNLLRNKDIPQNLQTCLKNIDSMLSLIIERNRNVNYYLIDEQILRIMALLDFYKETNVIITISNENAEQDIIVPTLLNISESIFVTAETNEEYSQKIESFFRDRGDETDKIKIINMEFSQEAIKQLVLNLYNECQTNHKKLYINWVDTANLDTILAIGEICSQQNYSIPLLYYDDSFNIISIENGKKEKQLFTTKRITISEYYRLLGENEKKKDKALPDKDHLALATKVFFDWHNDRNKYDWNKCIQFLQKNPCGTKDEPKSIYPFLQLLQKESLISNLRPLRVLQQIYDNAVDDKLRLIETLKTTTIYESHFDETMTSLLINKGGTIFEYITYELFKRSCLFDDVQINSEIKQDNVLGNEVPNKNEIDVVAIYKMKPIFVSCKTSRSLSKEYISEIMYWAKQYHTKGILVSSLSGKDLSGDTKISASVINRAKETGILIITRDYLQDQKTFNDLLKNFLKIQ